MASRQVVQQQNRVEGVAGDVNQKNMAAEGRNRRALGDIGNLVTVRGVEGKRLPQVSRPVTRSFCAQLSANAQAVAAENQKKCMAVNAEGAAIVADGVLPQAGKDKKPPQKKAVAKPKPEAVIEISSDSEEVKKEKNKLKAGEEASKKTAPTLTSTLTARSRAACGLSRKPNEVTVDIDAADVNNELAVVEYVEDIYKFYKLAEARLTSTLTPRSKVACGLSQKPKEVTVDIDASDVNNELAVVEYVEDIYKFYKLAENESRVGDYMHSQPEVNEKMRAILIDWLIEVHHKFELNPETLYLAINIIDRYLAVKATPRKELQLVGMGAMLIASKYEEIWAPEVNDFVCMSDRAYTHEQVLVMEKRILGGLEWHLTVPTLYVFLVRFIKASIPDSIIENMVYFLAELGMMNYATIIYCPSMVAASAVYAARCTLNKNPLWDETLKLHTGYSEPQLLDCAKLLVSYHSTAVDHKLKVIYRKYSSSERGVVALLPPAKTLLAAA